MLQSDCPVPLARATSSISGVHFKALSQDGTSGKVKEKRQGRLFCELCPESAVIFRKRLTMTLSEIRPLRYLFGKSVIKV